MSFWINTPTTQVDSNANLNEKLQKQTGLVSIQDPLSELINIPAWMEYIFIEDYLAHLSSLFRYLLFTI